MRAKLLDAALELFDAQGFSATTIDQIAERADVARQTVLNHYPAKKDFVTAWGGRRRSELAAMDTAGGSARDELHLIMEALAEINIREKRLTQQLWDQQIAPVPVSEAVLRILHEGQRKGEIDGSVDPQVAGELFAAVYFDTLSRWLTGDQSGLDLRRMLDDRLNLLLDGLASRHRAAGEYPCE